MKQVLADIITIGDEILYGQIVDTNSQWISERLDEIGVRVKRKYSISDTAEDIKQAMDESLNRADIILLTGGLGPTKDDLTKHTLSEYFQMPLELNTSALLDVEEIFKKYNKELTDLNRGQAYLPKGCVKITNDRGTAPGMWFNYKGKVVVSMPGVPFEMKAMVERSVIPKIKEKFRLPVIHHKVIRTIGIGESWLSEMIADWEDALPHFLSLAYLPRKGQVRLRLTGIGEDKYGLELEMEKQVKKVLPIIQKYVFGFGDMEIEDAIGETLKSKGLTIGTAESCSGGFLAHKITSVAGSSEYYRGSIVSYHNDIKKDILGIKPKTLEAYGAVSEETATEMALNAQKKLGVDIAVATTGIAGPGGGSEEKPVGTVWLGLAYGKKVFTHKLNLVGTRQLNIEATATHALDFVRLVLSGDTHK
ncbi:competence/damage-inducible protein A [Reichenbachiella versicolor]|uniref:competence/damage-inducible protein A n=1 Tax=Reichenbachiella versicolor TaxID=1821036 RepID=UPI000D6DD3CD|nr:competence/damage-inducible protein A [Reichenbachiella versicolor]